MINDPPSAFCACIDAFETVDADAVLPFYRAWRIVVAAVHDPFAARPVAETSARRSTS